VVLENEEVHLVKRISKELGITYKELAEKIGYTESNLRKSVSQNKISYQLEKAINLYLKILELEQKLEDSEKSKKVIKENIKTLIGFASD
jgi:transcriptional regulator with XRE-family HTH domain